MAKRFKVFEYVTNPRRIASGLACPALSRIQEVAGQAVLSAFWTEHNAGVASAAVVQKATLASSITIRFKTLVD